MTPAASSKTADVASRRDKMYPVTLSIPADAHCLSCNYPLSHLPTPRCPECGRPFDPADPFTMNVGRPLSPLALRILAPARWPKPLAYTLASLLTLWSLLLPGYGPYLCIFLALGYAAILSLSILHSILKFITRRIYRQLKPRPNPDRPHLARARIAVLIAFALLWFELPFRAVFLVSRPSLEHLAVHQLDEVPYDTPYPVTRLCGLLPARITSVETRQVSLRLLAGGRLVYSPDDTPPYSWTHPTRLARHWYALAFY
jgi:hypothetical protein